MSTGTAHQTERVTRMVTRVIRHHPSNEFERNLLLTIATAAVDSTTSSTVASDPSDGHAEWHQALIAASREVLAWATHSNIDPIPFVPYSEEGIIRYRSSWLLDKYLSDGLIDIDFNTGACFDLALALVANGMDPESLPGTIDHSRVIELINLTDFGYPSLWTTNSFDEQDVQEKYGEACDLLRTNWSRIETLASAILDNPVMTARAVWEVIHPGITRLQRIGAYHLAAAAVAARQVGMKPTYLSLYCDASEVWGYEFELPRDGEKPLALSPLSNAIVSLAGPLASLKATGEAKLESASGYLTEFFKEDPALPENWPARATLFVEAAFLASEINDANWDTIERLATLLQRECCLLDDEITFILDGGCR